MPRWIATAGLLIVASCLQLGNHNDADGGASGGAAGADASVTTGVNCATDAATGVTLCSGISSCPTESLDPGQYPDCGYRIHGSSLDVECLCGDSLCPLGTALSCAQIHSLLADQSALAVCAGVAEGRCTALSSAPTTGTSGSCDPTCRASCAGDPGCTVLCGC